MCTGLDGDDLGPEQFHAKHVESLPSHIFLCVTYRRSGIYSSHKHCALHAKLGCHRGSGYTVLPCTCFCDDFLINERIARWINSLSKSLGNENLTYSIVDLMTSNTH